MLCKTHKVTRLAAIISAILLLNACDSSHNNDQAVIEPVQPEIQVQPASIRGVINKELISGLLPTGSLPAS